MEKIETLLGFAAKSGKVLAGHVATKEKMRKHALFLIVLAEDAAAEIKDYYIFNGKKLNIPVICAGTKLELGLAIGKSHRAVIGITDSGFAKSIVKQIRENDGMD